MGSLAFKFVLGFALILSAVGSAHAKSVNVQLQTLQPEKVERVGEYVGTLEPLRSVVVSSLVEGKVKKESVTESEPVKKGAVLAVVENTLLEKQIRIAETNMLNALNGLMQEELNLKRQIALAELDESRAKLAQTQWERVKQLYDKKLTSEDALQVSENAMRTAVLQAVISSSSLSLLESDAESLKLYENIQQQLKQESDLSKLIINLEYKGFYAPVEAALAQFKNSQSSYAQAVANYQYSINTAPFAGMILNDFDLEEGKYLRKGDSIAELADISSMEAKVGIKESEIGFISNGQKASIQFDAIPGKNFSGTVTLIGKQANLQNRTFPITITMSNKDGKLLSGMTARIKLSLETFVDSIFVPSNAIINKPQGSFVFIAENGVAKEVEVETGIQSGGKTLVNKGLAPGQQLIISGQSFLETGDTVVVVK